ncbi:MAG: hypothetical protein ACNA7E_00505 [Wenzhouxiangellaceae bacterium]
MKQRARYMILATLIPLAGCIVPVPRGLNPLHLKFMSAETLREYSEEVFRRHNRVVSRLMMATPEIESLSAAEAARLDRAEARMNEACAAINEIASLHATGDDSGFALQNEVRTTVRRCSARTKALERLLDQLEIPT